MFRIGAETPETLRDGIYQNSMIKRAVLTVIAHSKHRKSMISIEERKALGIQKCTLEGHPCHVAGYRMPDATITADFEGFWRCEWETVKRVIEGTRNFTANDVSFVSMQWKGTGEEMPEALRRKVLR